LDHRGPFSLSFSFYHEPRQTSYPVPAIEAQMGQRLGDQLLQCLFNENQKRSFFHEQTPLQILRVGGVQIL